jgi:hypothetical protein
VTEQLVPLAALEQQEQVPLERRAQLERRAIKAIKVLLEQQEQAPLEQQALLEQQDKLAQLVIQVQREQPD